MALSKMEKKVEAADQLLADKSAEADEILTLAEREDRDPTEDEDSRIKEIALEVKDAREKRAEYQRMVDTERDIHGKSKALDNVTEVEVKNEPDKSIGLQFVESKGYQDLLAQIDATGGATQTFSTGKVEIKAGTLLESGQGSGLIPVPQVVPGQVEKLFQRLTIADVLPSGVTSVNSLRYVIEGTATSGATAVSEGGAKPASDLTLSTVDEPVQKIATILTVSDELMSDAPAVSSYINGRLSLFVKITEEDQLIRGGGTPPNLSGFYNRAINTYPRATATDDNATALFKALNGTRGSSFLEPEAIFMHPDNWQTTRLLRDGAGGTTGQFFGGGPFTAAYGGPQGPETSMYPDGNALWGKPVYVTTAVGSGTALLGAFSQASQLFRRGGVTVEATNSHASYFTSNLVAIRAEVREALAVYRPSAFTKVTGLN